MADTQDHQDVGERYDATVGQLTALDFLLPANAREEAYRRQLDDPELAQLLQAEIVPRLLVAHTSRPRRSPESALDVSSLERQAFFSQISTGRIDAGADLVREWRRRGIGVTQILLEVLEPAARRLGTMWDDDDLDFASVTVSLCTLHRILRDLADDGGPGLDPVASDRRILLASLGQDPHNFGLMIVDQCFREAGWNTWTLPNARDSELVSLTGGQSFEIAGLSIGCASLVPELQSLIKSIRQSSHNRLIQIMVGGHVFLKDPCLVRTVGADGTAADGRDAVNEACGLLQILSKA